MTPAHQLFFHIAWTTLDRRPMIDAPTSEFLEPFIRRTVTRERAEVLGLAILRTHVHLILRTQARFDIPNLMQLIKGGSSYAASRVPGNKLELRWARKYSVTTVSPKSLQHALQYLQRQDERHPGEMVTRASPASP
ncbi:MAG TPA: transposase [Gemmatimonadales bacterium]|nr:transposase [Gemmatimonadales bacterium]